MTSKSLDDHIRHVLSVATTTLPARRQQLFAQLPPDTFKGPDIYYKLGRFFATDTTTENFADIAKATGLDPVSLVEITAEDDSFRPLHELLVRLLTARQAAALAGGQDVTQWAAAITRISVTANAEIQKPEPLPLLRVTGKNDPFPIEALPPVIQAAAARVREVVQAPLDLVCQSFLAAATLATQPLVDVLIDGRRFPVSNNYIAIGVSGERKSAVDAIATGPIKDQQSERAQAYHTDRPKFEAAKADWENRRKAASKEKDLAVMEALFKQAGDMPTHVEPCFICTEPSFQGIERAFAEGRYTMGLFSDEGGKFLGGYAMKQENQTNTITGLSKLWDGSPLDRLRVGDGKSPALTILYGRRFSVHLMLQPVLSGQLFGNSMMSGQGFLSRCLCCWPESTIGTRPYNAVDMAQDEAIKTYGATIKAILAAPLPMNEREEMGLSPRALTLTAPAKATWIGFHNHVEESQKPGGELFPITGFSSKTAEHAARIAGVLTIFQNPGATEIETEFMEAGIAIAQYYLGEALRLFHTSNDDLFLTLADECFRYGIEKTGGVIGLRDIYQSGPNAVRSKEKATQIMQILEEHNRAVRISGGATVSGKHNRDAWQLIPLEV